MTPKGIMLWIPSGGPPRSWKCVESYVGLESPNGFAMLPHKEPDAPSKTWNAAGHDFLSSGLEWLFSVHDDIVLHPQTLIRLLSWNKPLVSALAFNRKVPYLPFVFDKWADEENKAHLSIVETFEWLKSHPESMEMPPVILEPRPKDALKLTPYTSTCCCLIHRSVMQSIKPPWFVWDGYGQGGEDRNFFQLAAKAGFPVYVDRSNIVGHLPGGDEPIGALNFYSMMAVAELPEE